ncbi:ferrous iron transport protein B [Caminicella sporogenes DSM 14501]|uniref:Ferrous iron transport protein B n=1 Tax=Caminicella sporogenes DSM 14501 TaxID=1121266 RepID=A0A1M6PEX3_9FIRM|nr:ferrous iron transport protein B [Caminicella sporogenes]RKD21425.1 ferrous iron transport protein B [Caminicella sporogenes]SHK06464.1 ferrous iron transport protein B [Caminicella sporogenes DSM 14501]
MAGSITIALAGNPNSGKTTLFNALTGARHSVGNWPGVTVEKKEGKLKYRDNEIIVVDLPGTYSLSPYSIEEIIARNYIVEDLPDVVVNIVDASNIERNLYLSMQLIELGKPVVIALNMMDIAEKRGIKIDCKKLSEQLGVPVVPIVATKEEGVDDLLNIVVNLVKGGIPYNPKQIDFGKEIEGKIEKTIEKLKDMSGLEKYNLRWLALKVLEEDEAVLKLLGMNLKTKTEDEIAVTNEISLEDDFEALIADKRYSYIAEIVSKTVKKPKNKELTMSDRVDKILTNRWLGLPIFALIMYGVFYFTFDLVGNKLLDMIDVFFAETLSGWVTGLLESVGAAEWLKSLIVDGIIGGVGGVLVFLPNIVCLFLAISILEDSGYMARVAFIMDRAMRKIGLSGKAFIPMILGFGCNVPAIMGTRTLEDENDRLTAILINPFISCSARLPVYTLFAAAFFPGKENKVVFSLYILGILIAIIVGLIFKKTLFKSDITPFVMELPPYRIPTLKDTLLHVWERVKGFLIKAGTLIFGASIVLWFILGYNFSGPVELTESFGAAIGRLFAPIFAPLGFGNWQATLSLITGVLAKEVVVSNMSIIYGLAEEPSAVAFAQALGQSFTQLTAYAFMVFVLLYTPCIATVGIIKRETNSWKWTGFSVAYQFAVAWFVSMIVFQVGRLLGF